MKLKIPSQTFLYFILIFVGASGFFFSIFLEGKIGFYAFLSAAALGGLGVATNIWNTKRHKRDLVCPTGSNCNVVVNSKYSKFFGIPLEYLGMLYFFVILVSYLTLIFFPALLQGNMVTLVALLTIGAALFSCYLLFVQAVLLRAWCIWCILASILSLTIFFISLISLPEWVAFMANFTNVLEMLQFLGYALGLGGVTSAIFLFFNNFISDRNIDEREFDTLRSFSELVWFGFGLVMLMQFAFYVMDPFLIESSLFVARIISLFISAFAGAIMMIILSPFLVYIPFSKDTKRVTWLSSLRKPIFIVGSIAVSSWYFAFATSFMPDYSFASLSTAYLATLAIAIVGAVVWEGYISNKSISDPEPSAEINKESE